MVGKLLVSAGLASCSAAAWLPALAQRVAILRGWSRRSGSLAEEGDVTVFQLHDIWFARLCRELFAWPSRSGLGSALADRVAWSPPDGAADDGCVFALLATPWSHFLTAWAARQPAAHVLIDGNWARRTRPAGARSDGACLRGIVRKLRNGHRVAASGQPGRHRPRRCDADRLRTPRQGPHPARTPREARRADRSRRPERLRAGAAPPLRGPEKGQRRLPPG